MSDYKKILLAKRLYWDILSKSERKYYYYFFIAQIPCLFGNMLRGKFIAKNCKKAGHNLKVLAGTRFRSMENLVVGDNVIIGNDNFIQAVGGVTIGDNVMTGPGVKIWSIKHSYKDKKKLVAEQGYTSVAVVIGNGTWIASDVFISPGARLGDGVVVFPGTVIGPKDYEAYSVLAGNPARIIDFRVDTPTVEDNEMQDE